MSKTVFLQTDDTDRTILQQLRKNGILLESPCNGKGKCGKCKVRLVSGVVNELTEQEKKLLSKEEISKGVRLACLAVPFGNVEIDSMGLLQEKNGIVLKGESLPEISFQPMVSSQIVRLDQSLLKEGDSLWEGVFNEANKDFIPSLRFLKRLPSLVDLQYTWAVEYAGHLLDLRMDEQIYGLAIDIGTTTIAVSLVNLKNGKIIGEDGFINPQKAFGLDVLSRIHYASEQSDGVGDLQSTVIKRIQKSADGLAGAAGISTQDIYEMTVGGNTTMIHALLGFPLKGLGRAPYRCVSTRPTTVLANQLGFSLNTEAQVYCIPSVSTYIGGDIVSGVLAARLEEADDTVLFIDIGTNGEIVLCRNGKMYSCSCAAGPALEGMNISKGMRAQEGAIEAVKFCDGKVILHVIGEHEPEGICGSGILDAISEGVRCGIILKTGRIQKDHPLTDTDENGKRRIVLDGRKGIYITQVDIRQVQLCKGAILSGILTLLEHLSISPEDIDRVLVAGQFGRHLKQESLTGAGLIPQVLMEKISYIGNSSQIGALMCLLSKEERRKAEEISKSISYIELSVSSGYERLFTKSLQFIL